MQPNDELNALADEHRVWLSSFDAQYLKNWEKLHAADYEAAMTEASVRRMLQGQKVAVEPNEKLTGICGGPDFRCYFGGDCFYVEVTCISIASAEQRTGIIDGVNGFSPFNVTGMVQAIFNNCVNKAPQCADLDGPALVVVGTWHGAAAMAGFQKVLVNMVLTGKTKMAWTIDIRGGQQVGDTYQTTELEAAAFLRPDKTQQVGFARSSISGVLAFAAGLGTRPAIGVLHPNPARSFDPTMLRGVEFGQVEVDCASSQLIVRWPNDGRR